MRVTNKVARSLTLLLGGGSLLALAANPAAAQEAAAKPAADTGAGEIVVTAQKRSESIQHVPISLQALGSATIEQHQIQSFDDYAKQLPSVSFQSFGPGQSQLFFRGITSGGDGIPFGALPTSGVYVDEIPVTTIGSMLDMHIYDMARVEALSGPQGTLYGASSLSGTLRMITNKPELGKTYGSIDGTVSKYGKGDVGGTIEGFVNIPLARNVAIRAVGWYEHDGGYIDNTYGERTYQRPHTVDGSVVNSPMTVNNGAYTKNNFNDVDTAGGRISVLIETDTGWKITPQLMGQYQTSHGSFLYDPRAGDLQVHDYAPERNRDDWFQAALTIEGKIADWDLVYSGGYMGRKIRTSADYSYYTVAYDVKPDYNYFLDKNGNNIDPTQRYQANQNLTKQTHELRISSPSSSNLRFTGGLFMQHQTNHSYQSFYVPGVGENTWSNWADGQAVYGDSIFMTNAHITFRDYAVFGEASYNITHNLTFTGGIRGFISDNSLRGYSGFSSYAPSSCSLPLANPEACTNIDKRTTASGETHKLNLTWQIDRDHMVYFTYSTGYRPGGNNRRAGVNAYGADTLDNFELGWKTSWFDHKLRFNGAIYYEKWNNLQYALVVEGSGGITNIYNAGDARVYGAEFDLQLHPIAGLTLSASGAYNDAALSTDFCSVNSAGNPDCSTGSVAAPKGTRLPIQPRFKMAATARYEFAVGKVNAFVQGSLNTQTDSTSMLSVSDNQLLGNSQGFTTADFSVGGKSGDYSVQLFIQNAFDTRGSLSHNVFTAASTSGQYYRIYPIKPQYFGLKIGRKF
ncbi:TonB-dependent receptor [Novosphingobium nitrogenifigens DSM 19370]|uniref:TonB-dependent receptor n=2 Tax=Novosphingobium nitrogenifigens TaxID=378548 RepID=F1ZAW1_9SPHN|nr:TonB-dependent receptor [Novosphingobium nitrogenifigens DSM 19370]